MFGAVTTLQVFEIKSGQPPQIFLAIQNKRKACTYALIVFNWRQL